MLDETPEIVDNPGATQLAPMSREVRLNGVGFSYSPERRTLEGIETASDAQEVAPSYVGCAIISLILDDEARAAGLLETALSFARKVPHRAPMIGGQVAAAVVQAGYAAQWLELLAGAADTRRVETARLVFTGRTVEAAEEYARFSGPGDEAPVRLLAAEQLVAAGRRAEADAQLRRALAFYGAVGATRIVRKAEALLAQPA